MKTDNAGWFSLVLLLSALPIALVIPLLMAQPAAPKSFEDMMAQTRAAYRSLKSYRDSWFMKTTAGDQEQLLKFERQIDGERGSMKATLDGEVILQLGSDGKASFFMVPGFSKYAEFTGKNPWITRDPKDDEKSVTTQSPMTMSVICGHVTEPPDSLVIPTSARASSPRFFAVIPVTVPLQVPRDRWIPSAHRSLMLRLWSENVSSFAVNTAADSPPSPRMLRTCTLPLPVPPLVSSVIMP